MACDGEGNKGGIGTEVLLNKVVAKCPLINTLSLGCCMRMDVSSVLSVIRTVPGLSNIYVAVRGSGYQRSSLGLSDVEEGQGRQKRLSTKGFLQNEDQMLELVELTSELYYLDISECDFLSDKILKSIADGSPHLNEVSLRDCGWNYAAEGMSHLLAH
eukprot:gene34805-42926_t